MKKRRFIISGICALAACLCFGAGCSSVDKMVDGDQSLIPPYDGQHDTTWGSDEGSETPDNDPVTVDGVLDETIYSENAWMDYTTKNKDGEGLGTSEINVKGTTVYGEEGFYVAFDVSNSFVFVDLEHNRYAFYDSGISVYLGFPGSTSHNYEICLIPDGFVRVASYMNNGFVDGGLTGVVSAGTVKGEMNTYEADGYYIETYFPWSAFGLEEAPCGVKMDIAVVASSDAEMEGRDGWESLGSSYLSTWRWANPASYWTWGAGGFESAPLDITIAEYDSKMGSVSLGKESYSALEDVVINIAPEEGYTISSVLVNGTQMRDSVQGTTLTLSSYSGAQALDIQVVFIAVSDVRVEVSGKVTAVAGASAAWNVPEGSALTFSGAAGTFTATVGKDGTYSAELPYGTFTATVNGYSSQEVTVEQGATEAITQNIQLRYDLIGAGAAATVSEDESTVTPSAEQKMIPVNTSAEQFSLSFRVKVENGGSTADGAGTMFVFGGQNFSFQCGYIDNSSYMLRVTNISWTGKEIPINDETFMEEGVEVLVIRDEDTYAAFYRLTGGDWVEAARVTQAGVSEIYLYNWSADAYFTDIKYAPSYELITIDADITAQYGNVSLADEYIIGEDVVINIAAQSGFNLQSIEVNGKDMTASVSEGTLTVAHCGAELLTIVATFVPDAGEMYTISGTVQAVAGASEAWDLPDGTVLSFAGSITQNVTVKDGAYSVELPEGEFTLTVEGYGSQTISVTGAETKNLSLRYDLLANSSDYTVAEDESTATPSGEFKMITLNADSEQFSVSFKVNVKDGGNPADGIGFRIDFNNTMGLSFDNYSFQCGLIDGGYALRVGNEWSGAYGINISADDFASGALEVLVIRNGNTFTGYYRLKDGDWIKAGNSITIEEPTKFSLYAWTGDMYFTDIKFAPTHELVTVKADVTAENGTVELAGNYLIGQNVVLNVKPDEGYLLSSLLVNGEERSSAVSDGKLTISACAKDTLTIVATFVAEADEGYVISGTAQGVAGASNAWKLPEGTILNFTGDAVYNATVNADGAYSVRLPNGEYTVSAVGYGSQTITVSGEATENISLRYDLLGTNENVEIDENETTATPSTQWNGVPVNIASEQFTISFKVNLKESGSSADGIGFKILVDNSEVTDYTFQCGYIDGAWRIRIINSDWAGMTINVTDADVTANGIQVMIVADGNTYTAYIMNDGVWTRACSVTAEAASYQLYNWSQDMYFTDISYVPSFEAIGIEVNISETVNGNVSVADSGYVLGDDVVLNVIPETGYLLQSLKVNGTEMSTSVTADGKLVIAGCGWLNITVEATFAEAPEETYTISGNAQAVAGASQPWTIPDGTELSFVGTATQKATVTDGKYTVTLGAGVYTVTAEGYGSQTIIVSKEGTVDISLRYDLIGTNDKFTVSEDETTVTPSSQYNGIALNASADKFTLTFKVNLKEGGNTADGLGFKVFTQNSAHSNYVFQCGVIDGNAWMLRVTELWTGATISTTDEDVTANGIEVMIVKDGNKLDAYYRLQGGEWTLACSVEAEAVSYELYNWSADMYFSDISYTPNLVNAPSET